MLNNRLLGHASIYTLSNFAVAGAPFLLLPILTRILDPASYGMVAMFSLVVAFVSVWVGVNIHGAITVRFFDRSNFSIPEYVSAALLILISSFLLILALMFIGGAKIAQITSIPMKWLYATVLIAFLQFLVQILLALWQASGKPIQFGVLRISQVLLDTLSTIVLVVVLTLSWEGRLSGMLFSWFFIAIVAVYLLIRQGWLSKSIKLAYAKDALWFGVPLIPHALGGLLLGMGDRLMVNSILDVSSTGIYVVAVQLGLILGVFADSFNKAFAPWLMEKLNDINESLKKKIVTFTYVYFFSIIVMAILGAVISPYILPFIVGPEFQESGSLLIYILLGNAFIGMYYMVTNYIFYSRKTWLLSMLTISVGIMSMGLTWFLVNTYGVTGAAMGFMFGQASMFLGAWILANFCVPMPWFKIFLLRKSINQ